MKLDTKALPKKELLQNTTGSIPLFEFNLI